MPPRILIACEESQTVCKAFRSKGFEAYSCDIQEPSGGHPEWHILGDALIPLRGGIITTMDGKEHESDRVMLGIQGRDLFMRFWWAEIPLICVENPVPSKVFCLPPYTQAIQPYQFGHPYTKKTCLWLKGLPPLESTNVVEPVATWCPSGSYSHKHGEQHKGMFTTDRAKNRAKTFTGIAAAMAEQWGDYLLSTSKGD